jgi:hypothetical protein
MSNHPQLMLILARILLLIIGLVPAVGTALSTGCGWHWPAAAATGLQTAARPAGGSNDADVDAAGNLVVYLDALGHNWYDWSWATVNTAYTLTTHSGTHAVAIDPDGYGAFSPFFSNGQDWTQAGYTGLTTADFDRLSFWVQRGASAGGQTVEVQAADILPGWAWRHRGSFTVPTDDAWHEVTIPLAEIDAVDTRLARLAWVGNGADTEPILLDDIKLLKAPAPVVAAREPMSDTSTTHWLYRDERATRLDGSWSADVRFQAPVASRGAFGLGAQFGWFGGLQFKALDCDWQTTAAFATGTANVLQFDLNRGPLDPADQSYDIYGQDGNYTIVFKAPLARFVAGGEFDTDPDTWQAVTVPLDTLRGAGDGVYAWGIQEANGVNGQTADAIYLDEVRFDYRPPPPDLTVYTDTPAAGWTASGSWDSTVALDSPAPVYAGAAALAVTYLAPWAGLYLHADTPLSTVDYRSLGFWLHAGAAAGQPIQLWVHDAAYQPGTVVALTTPLSDTWQWVQVSLVDLGDPAEIRAIAWQDGSGAAQPAFYLDEIVLSTAVPPPPPPRAGPALQIDVTANRHPISPDIYGINFAEEALAAELRLPVRRWGGNSTTRYNWQNDTSNKASDWYFENIPEDNPDPAALPAGSVVDRFIEQDRRTGTRTIVTVPLIGWTPKSRAYACGFSVARYGPQQSTDPWRPDCGSGRTSAGALLTGNDPLDTSAAIGPDFVQAWLSHLIDRFGPASEGGVALYSLDNEPMLWNATHRDVHPQPVSYDELRDRTIAYAAAIKAADPGAQTLGPVLWGWTAYFYSALDAAAGGDWWNQPADRTAHGGTPFVEWYLQQMQAYETAHGVRLLDYLDLHFYPQGSGVALAPAGDLATQALRLRSTRGLWDPAYTDESWIAEPVRLIPRMKEWVAANAPGVKLALTEYNWGALESINGALAQADILGIFGREGLDLATLWAPPAAGQPGAFAFRMFRNYDGIGSAFGETGVRAISEDQARLAVYAAQRVDGALTMLVINKTLSTLAAPVSLAGFEGSATAAVYRYCPANLHAIVREADQTVTPAGFEVVLPPQSLTLFVLPPDPVTPALTLTRHETDAVLRWPAIPANAGGAIVWASTYPYLLPNDTGAISATLPAGTTVFTHTGALNQAPTWFYLAQGVNSIGETSAPGVRIGLFDFSLLLGSVSMPFHADP